MRSAIVIQHGDVTVRGEEDRSEKTKAIKKAVEDLLDESEDLGPIVVDGLTINLGAHRKDWEEGEPCPECGSTMISVMNLSEDRYVSEDGMFVFIKKGDAIGPDTSYVCGDCGTFLKYTPSSA